jgi:hypothetical protein
MCYMQDVSGVRDSSLGEGRPISQTVCVLNIL